MKQPTFTLKGGIWRGREVLARPDGSPVQYANRTQAARKVAELGLGWQVIGRRPFYAAQLVAHPQGKPCPLCTQEGMIFAAVHVATPPCLNCRAPNQEVIGDWRDLYYRCTQCGYVKPVEPD